MCIHYNTTDPVWVESQEISVKDQKKLCVRKLITVIFIIVKTLEKTKCLPIDIYPFQIEIVLYFQRIKSYMAIKRNKLIKILVNVEWKEI